MGIFPMGIDGIDGCRCFFLLWLLCVFFVGGKVDYGWGEQVIVLIIL